MGLVIGLAWGWAGVGAAADEGCWSNATTHADQDRCQAAELERLDDALNAVYAKALAALPARNADEPRKTREQLRKSQRAWLVFIKENCALEGGQQGGSSAWVNTFSRACKAEAVGERITFLKNMAGEPDTP